MWWKREENRPYELHASENKDNLLSSAPFSRAQSPLWDTYCTAVERISIVGNLLMSSKIIARNSTYNYMYKGISV